MIAVSPHALMNLEPGTLNSNSPPPLSPSPGPIPEPRTLNPSWRPSDNDHLIFHWVKMEGKTQSEVASMLQISQPTVCRVVQRYERWQAHRKARENGLLDPRERLRAQRCQTFECNQLILASCLRIAKEVEGFIDAAKSTVHRPFSDPSAERAVRTQHFSVDRTGMAARFLRLAYRISMDQLKLADEACREDDPLVDPLSDQQLADEANQAALDDAEIARGTLGSAANREAANREAANRADLPREGEAPDEPVRAEQSRSGVVGANNSSTDQPAPPPSTPDLLTPNPASDPPPTPYSPLPTPSSVTTHDSPTHDAPALVNNVNNQNVPQIAATSTPACTCTAENALPKNPASPFISVGPSGHRVAGVVAEPDLHQDDSPLPLSQSHRLAFEPAPLAAT